MTIRKKFMSLIDKKYPVYMDLVQMAAIMDMYNEIGSSRIWKNKERKERLRSVVEEMRIISDDWLRTRNEQIQKWIDEKRAQDDVE